MSRSVVRSAAKPAPKRAVTKTAAKSATKPAGKPAGKPAAKALQHSLRAQRRIAEAPAQAPRGRDAGMAAVGQTIDLLDVLARLGPVATATVEREIGCPRATALRLLAALESRGFAIHVAADDMWQLGARWGVLQRAAQSQGALAAASMPFMAALARATGENVYLRARDGMEAETIAVYQADPGLRVYTAVGKRGPLHAGPARLLLAHAPEPVQTQVLAQRLPRFTPATRTDTTWIAADLHRLRARGYLITADEVNAGVASVSAPVRDASGQVIAVLILSAPSMRLRPPRPRQLLPQVLDAAAQLSRALGGPAGQSVTVVPAANGGPLPGTHPGGHPGAHPGAHAVSSLPTAPASPAAWVR